MYTPMRSPKNENNENFQRQGSLRRVLPPAHNENIFDRQNAELNKVYKIYRQEYLILAEYKMIQTENIHGVYVIPSNEDSLIWFGVIYVRSGPYEDGVFRFNIILDENFPDCEHPKVVFQSEIFHPVIDPVGNELNLLNAFPKWNKNEQHLWQVLKFIQWSFYNVDATIPHAVNKEAAEMYKSDQNAFKARAQEVAKLSKERLYDEPPTEDKHYIHFERYVPEVHDEIKASMISFKEEQSGKVGQPTSKVGHSWVLPGTYKALGRPSSPQSESES